jgi:hypothetical protein
MAETSNPIVAKFTDDEKNKVKELKNLLPDILKDADLQSYTLWGVALDKDSNDGKIDVILVKFLRAR